MRCSVLPAAFKELAMRRYKLLLTGLLMVGTGASLIFWNHTVLPLWFIWLAGPFLWYVGIAISISGMAFAFFLPLTRREEQALLKKKVQKPKTVLLDTHRSNRDLSSAVLAREIPAMGGFIM
jgi:hypothetical protein